MPVDAYLPTVERALGEGLLPRDGQIRHIKRLAALLVLAKIVRRESWREARHIDPLQASLIPSTEPPVEPGKFRSWRVGFNQQGAVLLEHVTDKVINFRDVFIATALTNEPRLFGVESAIEELVPNAPGPEFECPDLRTQGRSSAYRGELGGPKRPMFFEHDFEDAIELGKAAVVQLLQARGKLLSCDIRAYAWPLLWVRYDLNDSTIQTIILPDASGVLHAVTSTELMEREEQRRS